MGCEQKKGVQLLGGVFKRREADFLDPLSPTFCSLETYVMVKHFGSDGWEKDHLDGIVVS